MFQQLATSASGRRFRGYSANWSFGTEYLGICLGNGNTTTRTNFGLGTNWGFDMANVANGITSDFRIIRHGNSSTGTVALDINRDTGTLNVPGSITTGGSNFTISNDVAGGLGGSINIGNDYDGSYGSTYSALFLDSIKNQELQKSLKVHIGWVILTSCKIIQLMGQRQRLPTRLWLLKQTATSASGRRVRLASLCIKALPVLTLIPRQFDWDVV